MNTNPKISVVIPLYNKVNYIKRALDSVLAQTYQDFEVIVVNDGSTDGSEKVVEQYADPRIRLIHREHSNSWGGHAARNLGISQARADLIAFLDADDEWLPEHLATIMRLREKFPQCGAYASAFEIVDPLGRRYVPEFGAIPEKSGEGIITNYFRSLPICSSSVAVPKCIFDNVGFFPAGIRHGGDMNLWLRIALKYPIACSTTVGAIYHQDAENRVGNDGEKLAEFEGIEIIEKAIATGDFPENITRNDLIEYMSWRLITRAVRNVKNGYPKEARRLLRKAASTKKYSGLVRRWLLLSYVPVPLLRLALVVRNFIIIVRHRLTTRSV